jgi:DNA-binding transcriptional LysR family regulator
MDIALLRSFVAIAESGSFSAAAQQLHLTQSSISHQIARLEHHMGRRLFDRTTRSCELSTSGRLLLEQASEIIQKCDELERQFRPDALRGHVRLGVPDDPHLFAAIALAIMAFTREQPLVTLDIQAGMSLDLSRSLKDGDLDLALVRDVPSRDSDDCILKEQLVWVGKSGTSVRPTQTVPLALVSEPCAYRRTALHALQEAGLRHAKIISCSSLVAVLAFVEAGLAISAIVTGMLERVAPAIAPMPNLPPLPNTSLVFRHRSSRPTVLARELMRRLEHAIRTSVDAPGAMRHPIPGLD